MTRDLLRYENSKKSLDTRLRIRYNEFTKSEEWFLARKEVEDETGKC